MRLLFSRGQESRRPRPMSLVLARVRVLFARARGSFLSDSKIKQTVSYAGARWLSSVAPPCGCVDII